MQSPERRSEIARNLKQHLRSDKPRSFATVNFNEIVEAIFDFEMKTGLLLSKGSFFALGYGFSFVEELNQQVSFPELLAELEQV